MQQKSTYQPLKNNEETSQDRPNEGHRMENRCVVLLRHQSVEFDHLWPRRDHRKDLW